MYVRTYCGVLYVDYGHAYIRTSKDYCLLRCMPTWVGSMVSCGGAEEKKEDDEGDRLQGTGGAVAGKGICVVANGRGRPGN